jgi:hypothetical protein
MTEEPVPEADELEQRQETAATQREAWESSEAGRSHSARADVEAAEADVLEQSIVEADEDEDLPHTTG